MNDELLRLIGDLQRRVEALERVEKIYTPVYDDFVITTNSVRIPASGAPSWTAYKGSQVLEFSASATNTVYFSAQLPHSYKEGSNIEFHIHLAYPNGNSGNSIWQMTHSWANMGDAFPAETTITDVTIAAPEVADTHQYAELTSGITGTGKKISSCLLCSVSRLGGDSDDTLASVIYLVSDDFHIQRDALGSRTETAK